MNIPFMPIGVQTDFGAFGLHDLGTGGYVFYMPNYLLNNLVLQEVDLRLLSYYGWRTGFDMTWLSIPKSYEAVDHREPTITEIMEFLGVAREEVLGWQGSLIKLKVLGLIETSYVEGFNRTDTVGLTLPNRWLLGDTIFDPWIDSEIAQDYATGLVEYYHVTAQLPTLEVAENIADFVRRTGISSARLERERHEQLRRSLEAETLTGDGDGWSWEP